MKGKSVFTNPEAKEIKRLINLKVKAGKNEQKRIRDKIRKIGFFASDFRIGGGYTVQDFLRVVKIIGTSQSINNPKQISKRTLAVVTPKTRSKNDESYIIDLCNNLLREKAIRQHRFDFLQGDTGIRLPVDAWYPKLKLVIEYRERQHTEAVAFFDKKNTASGITRNLQRKLYDQRRRVVLPKHGIRLIEFDYSEFNHTSTKRLLRNKEEDMKTISKKLKKYLLIHL